MNSGVIRPYAATMASTAPRSETAASARATGKRAATSVYDTPWTMPAGVVKDRGMSSQAPTASSTRKAAASSARCRCAARVSRTPPVGDRPTPAGDGIHGPGTKRRQHHEHGQRAAHELDEREREEVERHVVPQHRVGGPEGQPVTPAEEREPAARAVQCRGNATIDGRANREPPQLLFARQLDLLPPAARSRRSARQTAARRARPAGSAAASRT